MRLLVTGGAGFIGSHFIRYTLKHYSDDWIINLDKLTYAGNLENLVDVEHHPHYRFVRGDICDARMVSALAKEVDCIINFAAETHVDRSIMEPGSFIQTDLFGTYVLMEAARKFGHGRFIQISTDEVYGSVEEGRSPEEAPLQPSSPYSASKASAELLVLSYIRTYQFPGLITRSSNNFGPYQYPEKLIPLFITNALIGRNLPLYGNGQNVRDWIYVEDNCAAIDLVLHKGELGHIYNIAAGNERCNIDVARLILKELGQSEALLQKVEDRPGHDQRYALDTQKISALGFQPSHPFEQALWETVRWYRENNPWWEPIKSGEFQKYYQAQYLHR